MRFEYGILKKKNNKNSTKNIENKYMQEYDKHANILIGIPIANTESTKTNYFPKLYKETELRNDNELLW